MKQKGFYLYRIYYGNSIVYVGRTKQKLTDRIRGHLFSKPMHRTIHIEQVSKIEYSELQTEADMNLYEIYYILTLHPAFNVDDKTKDYPTVNLPPLEWIEFHTPLWQKWQEEVRVRDSEHQQAYERIKMISEDIRIVRSLYRTGEIDEDEMWKRFGILEKEKKQLEQKLYGIK